MRIYITPEYKANKIETKDVITLSYTSEEGIEKIIVDGVEVEVKSQNVTVNVGKLL